MFKIVNKVNFVSFCEIVITLWWSIASQNINLISDIYNNIYLIIIIYIDNLDQAFVKQKITRFNIQAFFKKVWFLYGQPSYVCIKLLKNISKILHTISKRRYIKQLFIGYG